MANKVTVEVIGSDPRILDGFNTVGEIRDELNKEGCVIKVNGNVVSDDTQLSDYAYVSISDNVKGGR